MAKRQSIAEARKNLPHLVREVESGKPVELTRRGEPVAVLMGRRQYAQLAGKRRRFFEAYLKFTREFDLADLSLNPDVLFSGVRDETEGREVNL